MMYLATREQEPFCGKLLKNTAKIIDLERTIHFVK